jgi:alpha-glucosidase (family GH31 glycosyl hydrolase)
VYLPQGFWYDVETNKCYAGSAFVKLDVTDYKKPLFYKEGSFIPQYECNGENTVEINRKKLKVIYIPSEQKSAYEMYDDDGETKNAIALNQFELIKFSSTGKTDKGFTINIQTNNGNYKNKPTERNINLTIPTIEEKPKAILVNSKPFKEFKFENNTVIIPTTLKNMAVKIEVRF